MNDRIIFNKKINSVIEYNYNPVLSYLIAIVLYLFLGLFFIDRLDGPVFFDTGKDILVSHKGLYYENSLQNKFNYFPFAYLAILPGQFIYFLFSMNNRYLWRFFLKLPYVIVIIILSLKIRKDLIINKDRISNFELFILFNPIIIYSVIIKGQFDIFPTLFLYFSWSNYKKRHFMKSGFYGAISILFKQYGVFYSYFLTLFLLKKNRDDTIRFILGHILIAGPVLLVSAIINFSGLVDHAILFHINRNPFGYSLTSMITNSITNIGTSFKISLLVQISSQMPLFFTIILIALLCINTYKHLKISYSNAEFLKNLNLFYILFYLLSKGFLFHYLTYFIVLVLLYTLESDKYGINKEHLVWNVIMIPLFVILKLEQMVPIEVQSLLGDNWYIILIGFAFLFHGFLLLLSSILKIKLFYNRKIKYYYLILLTLMVSRLIGLYFTEIRS